MISQNEILGELMKRVQANHNGSLVHFQNVGLPLQGEQIALVDLKNLYEQFPDAFLGLVEFLYPEFGKIEVASADGEPATASSSASSASSFDWMSLVGGILMGAGSGLTAGTSNTAAMQQMQYEHDLAAQEAKNSHKMLYLILGIFAVLVVAAVIIFKRRR